MKVGGLFILCLDFMGNFRGLFYPWLKEVYE